MTDASVHRRRLSGETKSVAVKGEFPLCFVDDAHPRQVIMAKTIKNGMRPVHPGEVLSEELMKPMGLSSNRLAEAIGVPANRVSTIVTGKRDVTADTALRLARFFGSSPTFWMNLQAAYDLSRQ